MNNVEILEPARPVTTGGYKVDVSRGGLPGLITGGLARVVRARSPAGAFRQGLSGFEAVDGFDT